MSKSAGLIASARNTAGKEAGKLGIKKPRKQKNKKTAPPKAQDREVGISIKVAESRRRHWVSEAKKQGTTLTAVICQALSARFGEP